MANYIYGAVSLIGGGTGSLDSIDGNDLAQGDSAIVFSQDATYIYTLDESSGGVESSPDLITPDANAENKRWILVSSRAAESALDVTDFDGILDANDDDVQKALDTIDDMFNSGDFSIGAGSVELSDTVVKAITSDSGTVTIANHSLDIGGTGKINTTGSGSTIKIAVDDLSVVTKTSSYSITTADDIVIGDCSGGNVEFTLPQASTKSAISIFKKSSSNALTVNCYGSETIEANASYVIDDEYGGLRLISDGVNTWVRSAEMYDLPTANSSTLGGIKIGDSLSIAAGIVDVDYSAIDTDILPDADITRSLGSLTKQWKDVFVGPGSLYVNGQEVVHDNSGTIVMSADLDQNIQVQSKGTGDIEFLPAGTGTIQMKGNFSVLAGKNIMSSDGNAISFSDNIDMNGNNIIMDGKSVATEDYVDNFASNASNITTGTLPSNVIPDIAISSIQVAASEAVMLGFSTQQGDTVIRTDLSKTYIHNGSSTSTMADFTELSTPVDGVSSVNGESGPTVVLTQDDIGDGSTYVRTANNLTDILKTKLDSVESGSTGDMTASEILTAIKTVDGPGSGLNADVLDNMNQATAATGSTIVARDVNGDTTVRYLNSTLVSMTGAISTRNSETKFYSSTDNYIRPNTAAGFKASLDLDQVENLPASTGSVGNNLVLRDASANFSAGTITATLNGNASTATSFQTARTINGVSFNGTANIIVDPFIADYETGDTNCPITFTANSTAGYKRLYEDSNLYYDNTNNILYSTIFSGVATTARYADLAEKHTCEDQDLITGTVVCACTEGNFEVKECQLEKCANVTGVVSEKAGYVMNQDLENSIIVGLVGKVPVRIVGPITKGSPIISAGNGCARMALTEMELLYKMGVALEANDSKEEKLVYCAIK